MKFPCNQCGWCCQNLDKNEIYAALDRGDGTCKWFDIDSKSCTTYGSRPLICNIEAMHQAYFSTIPYDEYIALNIEVCQSIQVKHRLPIIQI